MHKLQSRDLKAKVPGGMFVVVLISLKKLISVIRRKCRFLLKRKISK